MVNLYSKFISCGKEANISDVAGKAFVFNNLVLYLKKSNQW